MTWNLSHLCISCARLNLRREERKAALIMKTPAHSKLPACKTFNIEILHLWRSPNCTESFVANTLGWLTYLQSLEQYTFLHLFVSLARNRTEGESIPCRSQFQRVTPSKLEFLKGTRHSWLNISPTRLEHGPNIASKSLTWDQHRPNIGSYRLRIRPTWPRHGPKKMCSFWAG